MAVLDLSRSSRLAHQGGHLRITMSKYKYGQYARKSQEAKERQALSIPDQKKEFERAISRYGLRVTKKYEESKSAFKPNNRPEFDRMLEAIRSGQIDALLVWHLDRLCRNPKEGGELLQMLQDGIIKEIRTTSGDVHNQDSDHFVLQVHFGMANQYSRNISRNVRRGNRGKISRGHIPGGRLPDGLMHGVAADGTTKINIIDPKRFPKLKKAMHKIIYEQFTPMEALCYLNDELEYLTKRSKKQGGNGLSKSAWYRCLTNPIYMGDLSEYHQHHHTDDIDYVAEFPHMLTLDEFNKLQLILGKKGKRRSTTNNWPYNGSMGCGTCGSAIVTEERWQMVCSSCKHKFALTKSRDECPKCQLKIEEMKSEPIHYMWVKCGKSKKLSDGSRCPERSLPIDDFEGQVDVALKCIEIPEEFKDWAIDCLRDLHQDDSKQHAVNLRKAQVKYNQVDSQLRNLILMRTTGEIDEDEFQMMKPALKEQKKKCEDSLQQLQEHTDNWIDKIEQIFDFATYARHWFEYGTVEQQRSILQALGSNIFLHDKKVWVDQLKPFVALKELKNSEEYEKITFELKEKSLESVKKDNHLSEYPTLRRW